MRPPHGRCWDAGAVGGPQAQSRGRRVGPCVLSARAPGLTVLSSFAVKADRAESPCVDAAPDTLGTTGRAARTDRLLHGSPPPSRARHSAY